MNTAYPSNLTLAQYELISDLIPGPKPGGRPRTVDLWEVLNALFYILVEGVRWRSLPRDFPACRPSTATFGLGAKMVPGCKFMIGCGIGLGWRKAAIPVRPKPVSIVKR
jgi:Putative transposase of IS4/5 family (DUF4096)